ncbi:MAG TPA: bifunctional diaminohydroxyphosphoribosylaminopyrimidine deaminase/5-amino-6-(5-phosphoribosylamino)uracil reductase RibD [Spirochaetia bacterium]|nr:bifunctional diaminohydroxyphosphoribosylaminopyrimidine deaminase/5-amino-6-(5-phosphoribosylamino)uracil reductase RibD [Spirochaetia bacterium]
MDRGDESYMREALELAARAMGRTSPNPMVGALVVKDGEVVGRGYHHQAGQPHAEVLALAEAGERARGATLYVTMEPCCHRGRTGPCSDAVLASGVARVVAAMTDPNPKVAGKGLEQLARAGVSVACGMLSREAARLNEVFVKYITCRRPFVVLKTASSLDGKIATRTGDARWITGPAARAYTHRLRDRYDAILVGVNTVLADDPALTTRLAEGGGRDPLRVILDSLARTPRGARVLQGEAGRTLIAVTGRAPGEKVAELERAGAEILTVPGEGPQVDPAALVEELGRREVTSLLVEGGGTVAYSFLAAGLVDKVVWFLAPLLIGGTAAPPAVGGTGAESLAGACHLGEVSLTRLGEDFCLEAYPTGGGCQCLPD